MKDTQSNQSEVVLDPKGKSIDLFLQSMEKALFSGAVLVTQKSKTLLCKGYGNASDGLPNTPETIFHVASITKQFTAAAIMLLVEEGKIDLQACINEYLPTRFCTDDWDEVTVNHLLTHTSGIPNYADWDDYWDICKDLTVDKIIQDVQKEGLQFRPGSNFNYSNTGYTLLGKIIEKQGEMPYRDFIRKHLLLPAAMNSSGIHEKSSVPPSAHSAVGFWVQNQVLVKDKRDEFAILFSDGALYSTIRDLEKWSNVLDGKTDVLSKKSVDLMIKQEYGLMVDRAFGCRRIHHNGSMAGFRSDFCKFPDQEIFITVLGNNSDFVVEYLSGQISKFLLQSNYTLPLLTSYPPNFNDKPFLNTFRSKDDGTKCTFKKHDNQLFITATPSIPCYYLTNTLLFLPSEGQELELQKNGKIFVLNEIGMKSDVLYQPNVFSDLIYWIQNWFK